MMKKENQKEVFFRLPDRGKAFWGMGVALLAVLLFSALPWFLPMGNEADRKRSAERMEIKAKVDASQEEIMSRLDMSAALENEAELMLKAVAAPVREAAQKARPLPLAPEQA